MIEQIFFVKGDAAEELIAEFERNEDNMFATLRAAYSPGSHPTTSSVYDACDGCTNSFMASSRMLVRDGLCILVNKYYRVFGGYVFS